MAKVIDTRNSDGALVVLGDYITIPISTSEFTAVPGSIRYNTESFALELYAPSSQNQTYWTSLLSKGQIDNLYLSLMGGTITGDLTVTGSIYGTLISPSADIAEKYKADNIYDAGTVMVVGGECEVTISYKENDPSVAGIISSDPAMKLNTKDNLSGIHMLYIALKGRVPCKVIGPIKKGSNLTTSDIPGHAKMADYFSNDRSCFAIALEDCEEGCHVIEVKI